MIIPFLIAGIIIYIQLTNSLLGMTQKGAVHIASDIATFIEADLGHEIKLAASIAADPDIVGATKAADYTGAQQELEDIHQRIGSDYFTIAIIDKYGIARADAKFPQQIGLDLSDRDYFVNAKKGLTSIDGPILARGAANPLDPIIVISVPIMEDGVFLGAVVLPFSTDFIISILDRKKIGKTGYAYLMNSEGLVLIHPKKEYILKLRIFDQAGTEDVQKLIRKGQTGVAVCSFGGSEKIVGISKINLSDWIAVFAQSRDEIMSPVKKTLSAIFYSGIVFLLFTILIIVIFSSKISNPIDKTMEMMKQVTKHSTEIIVQIGVDKKIKFANPAFQKIAGLDMDSIKGTELSLHTPNKLPTEVIWNTLESGNPWSGRVVLSGDETEPVTLEVLLVPLRDRGVVRGYLAIGRDITAELMYEKRLQQSQKLEAIGTLAGGIAHDFNNILSGIFGFAELGLMKKNFPSETEKYFREILTASTRARDLVGHILTFSRKTEVELKPLRPKHILKEALKLLRASIPATIDIRSVLSSDSAILADTTQLHQVVMNLFTNAVHAIAGNQGVISVELEDFMVDVEFTKTHPNIKEGQHIILRISDTGAGIEPAVLDHIFEPFFTTKSLGKGTGLGLSVVHGIIKNFNGIITAYSEVGKGATFNIIIPIIEADDVPRDAQELLLTGGQERIALIDDEAAITISLRSILTNLGYTVTAFTDGMEALKSIQDNPENYDIIITDYSMPLITGLEIAGQLKETGINIPIILTSGFFGSNIEEKAREIGIEVLITKPLSSYQITEAIHRVLSTAK